jgi:hypothetical protein
MAIPHFEFRRASWIVTIVAVALISLSSSVRADVNVHPDGTHPADVPTLSPSERAAMLRRAANDSRTDGNVEHPNSTPPTIG